MAPDHHLIGFNTRSACLPLFVTDVFRVVDVWAVAGADDFRSAVLVADVNVDADAGAGVGCREPSETKKDIFEASNAV